LRSSCTVIIQLHILLCITYSICLGSKGICQGFLFFFEFLSRIPTLNIVCTRIATHLRSTVLRRGDGPTLSGRGETHVLLLTHGQHAWYCITVPCFARLLVCSHGPCMHAMQHTAPALQTGNLESSLQSATGVRTGRLSRSPGLGRSVGVVAQSPTPRGPTERPARNARLSSSRSRGHCLHCSLHGLFF
jgi:hypothetical protein